MGPATSGFYYTGTKGDDSLTGTDTNDVMVGYGGADTLTGLSGDDHLTSYDGSLGSDGAIDILYGGAGDDVLTGDGDGDGLLYGGAGNDSLSDSPGGSQLFGGAGDDSLSIGAGTVANGGDGFDRVTVYLAGDQAVVEDYSRITDGRRLDFDNGAQARNVESVGFQLGGGDDVIRTGDGLVHFIFAGGGDNWVTGGNGDDVFVGGSGNNRLEGGDGDDQLTMQFSFYKGSDTLMGGDGDDMLTGCGGADMLKGGSGSDVFVYGSVTDSLSSAPDTISDLRNNDVISLSGVDAQKDVYGNQAFGLVQTFTGHSGELTVRYSATDNLTYVEGDNDGDGTADLMIAIKGDHSDFHNFIF